MRVRSLIRVSDAAGTQLPRKRAVQLYSAKAPGARRGPVRTVRFVPLAFLAGAMLSVQHVLNARLLDAAGSPWAVTLVFYGGAMVGLGFAVTGRGWKRIARARRNRATLAYVAVGALTGLCYVSLASASTARVGVDVAIVLLLGGQVATGSLIDHFTSPSRGLGVLRPRRLLGWVLVAAAMYVPAVSADGIARVLAMISGSLYAICLAATDRLGRRVGSARQAALLNFAAAFAISAILSAALGSTSTSGPKPGIFAAPWWAFLAGPLGAAYVTLTLIVVRRLGLARTAIALALGQLGMALCLSHDHVTLGQLATVALLGGSVAILHRQK